MMIVGEGGCRLIFVGLISGDEGRARASGGGVRAAVFHVACLQRLALDGLLESTTFVSTVSGGSWSWG